MKFKSALLLITVTFLTACSTKSVKENINKAGDATGQVVGEFVAGASHGAEKAFDVKIDLPKNLSDNGIHFGKTTVASESGGTDNLLSVYIIFDKDFSADLTAKAFDNKGLEMGRVTLTVIGKKNEAKYFDFRFDPHTNIDSDSKLTLE